MKGRITLVDSSPVKGRNKGTAFSLHVVSLLGRWFPRYCLLVALCAQLVAVGVDGLCALVQRSGSWGGNSRCASVRGTYCPAWCGVRRGAYMFMLGSDVGMMAMNAPNTVCAQKPRALGLDAAGVCGGQVSTRPDTGLGAKIHGGLAIECVAGEGFAQSSSATGNRSPCAGQAIDRVYDLAVLLL